MNHGGTSTNPARVLIAGCGYVGTRLGLDLATGGTAVFGLRRDPRSLPAGITPVTADLLDHRSLASLPPDLDAVVYAAAADDGSDGAYEAAYATGVSNLLAALHDRMPGRILFTSSVGIYAATDGSVVDEESPLTTTGPSRHLAAGERRVAAAATPATKTTSVRFSGIYGPGRTRLLDSVKRGEARYHDDPPLITNRIHRDDCAAVLLHLLRHPEPLPCYVATDDEPATEESVLRFLSDELDAPTPRPATEPSRRGAGRRCSNARLKQSGFRFRFPTFREGYPAVIAETRADGASLRDRR